MISNVDLIASVKASKPDNSSKTAGFPSSAAEKPNDFKDSLRAAVRNKSQNEITVDDRTELRKELVRKAESKLTSLKKPDAKEMENFRPVEESNEEQTDKKEMAIEEILSKLEELANQQMGDIPADKQTVILEDIKEALKEITVDQTSSISGLEAENLQTKIAELTTELEGMQEELKTYGSLTDNEASEDFAKGLKAIVAETSTKVAETSTKIETATKKPADYNTAEKPKGQVDSNTNELTMSSVSREVKSDKELTAQKPDEKSNAAVESSETNEPVEKQKEGMKTEAPITDAKSVTKEAQPLAEENEDDVKTALDGKVEKVTVEDKESKKQDTEAEANKEPAKEVHKSASTTQIKQVNEEMTAIKLEQTVVDNKLEEVQKQAAVPKEQTVSKADIINQIVKKAEIIFTDSQSEMRMQLEPENLGKLTLKIAVERGLITAKFVAESHEVKQIIESNFNELKDMLQEKGLEVQNFSVSVGQNGREYNDSNAFQQWKETIKLNGRSMSRGNYEGYLDGERTASRTINPYIVHNGEFDHRA